MVHYEFVGNVKMLCLFARFKIVFTNRSIKVLKMDTWH